MGTTHRRSHDDSGIALAIVMSVIALMVLLATGAFYVASQTLVDTQMATRHDAAFQAASSGVVVAFTALRSLVASGTTPPPTWVTTGTVGASYAATTTFIGLNSDGNATYECTSTGVTGDGTREVVLATFTSVPPSSQPLPFGNNVFYFGGAQVGSVNGTGTVAGPLFILYPPPVPPATFPIFQFNGNEKMSGGPVYIQNAHFQSAKPAATNPTLVYTNGMVNGSWVNGVNNDGFIRWPLEATATLTVTPVTVSTFLPTSVANATAQSSDNILGNTATTDQEVNTVGDPSTYRSVRGPNVVTAGPYKVVSNKAASAGLLIDKNTPSFGFFSGAAHDDFAYNSVTQTLYVEGTVFVWGTLKVNQKNAVQTKYVGNGMIVCSGDIEIDSDVLPSTTQPDATHLLCLFTAGNASFPSNNGAQFTGALYSIGSVSLSGNNPVLQGSFLAEGGLNGAQNGVSITALPLIGAYISPEMPDLLNTSSGSGGANGLRMTAWRRL